jgi:RNA polymerase sigma factor (sigma-70 family)
VRLAGLAVREARRLCPPLRRVPDDELVAQAMPALVRAARDYDPSLAAFSTLAVPRMVGSLRSYGEGLRCGVRYAGRPDVQLSVLEAPWGDDGRALEAADPRALPPDAAMEEGDEAAGTRALALRALRLAGGRDGEVLRLRFLEDLTLEAAGRRLGLSKERVRQMEKRGLERARKALGVVR